MNNNAKSYLTISPVATGGFHPKQSSKTSTIEYETNGTPMFRPNQRSFGSKFTLLKYCTCDIVGTFRRPGNCAPFVTPLNHTLSVALDFLHHFHMHRAHIKLTIQRIAYPAPAPHTTAGFILLRLNPLSQRKLPIVISLSRMLCFGRYALLLALSM